VLLTVKVAAPEVAMRRPQKINSADIVRIIFGKERVFISGVKAGFVRGCPALEVVRIGSVRVLPIVEKPPFSVSWNPRWLIVDFCVPGVLHWCKCLCRGRGPHRGFATIVIGICR